MIILLFSLFLLLKIQGGIASSLQSTFSLSLAVICVLNNTSYHFLSVAVQDQSDSCDNGYTSLASRGYGYFFNGSSFSIGRPQLCFMGEYVPVCTSISEDEATVICYSSEGKYGELNQGLFLPC